MNILYIGGSGEISWSCVRESLALGHKVTIFNRGMTEQALPDGVEVLHGDMQDESAYRALAERRFDSVCQFFLFTTQQIERDIKLFSGKTGQYVFISSASAYYKPLERFAVITEDTPLHNPFWQYSRDKTAMEKLLFTADAEKKLPVTVVRPSHTYRRRFPVALYDGDWTAQRMLDGKPVLMHGDGSSLWTLTHADDFAKPFARLLGNKKALGEAFHITREEPYSWQQIFNAMAEALGVQANVVHVASETILRYEPQLTGDLLGDKTPSTMFDNSKVRSVAGDFRCTVSLQQGMAMAAEGFHQRRHKLQKTAQTAQWDALVDRIIADQLRLTAA